MHPSNPQFTLIIELKVTLDSKAQKRKKTKEEE